MRPQRDWQGFFERNASHRKLRLLGCAYCRSIWDLLPDGTCCTPKKWLTLEAGTFTIEAKGMPDQSFFESRPEGSTND